MLFYADRSTDSITKTITEVERRRVLQAAYNAEHGIVPSTIIKPVSDSIEALYDMDYSGPELPDPSRSGAAEILTWSPEKLRGEIAKLSADMRRAAGELRFEEAARMRDRLRELEQLELAR